MKNSIYVIAVSLFVLTLTSCKKNLDDVLVGTWKITEIKKEPTSGTSTTLNNTGTITFIAGGTGSYSIDYGTGAISGSLTWTAASNNATVAISAGIQNPVTGQYTVLTNKPKLQVWQQINTNGDKFTYRLEK